MAASLIQPLTITGVSQYSSDLQSILTRAVQLASLPAQQLQNQQTDLGQEQTLASSLSSAVANIATDMGTLADLGSSKGLVASSTDSSLVSATATGATAPASYTISNITSVASAASESSLQSYSSTQAVSANGSLQLNIGTQQIPISLGSGKNNLQGLSDAINASGAPVTATVLTTSSGDYLSVSADNPGATTLSLVDDPGGANTQLLTSSNQGADSVFQFDGVNVDTPSTSINNLVPGITFSINGTTTGSQTVGISLSSDSSKITSALQSLVTDFNALQTQVSAQTGSNGGLLTGNSIIGETRQAMLSLVSYYNPSGSIHSLSDLGISVDQNGQMSLDSTTLSSLSNSQINDAFTFLGSATTGLGALQSQFTQISDPLTGTIQAQQAQFTATNQRLTDQISTITDRVNVMQTNLASQLEAADAAIAGLESQEGVLTSSIQALQYSTYGQQILSSQGL
ncbi:hypothetical protein SBA3_1750004 [Candidatus Sulfopaludibacter sp. SbA3]|nr:hypothetical protein SBA3_1750004 [Candidatus Sulfopaludibacter sp. SbA3]